MSSFRTGPGAEGRGCNHLNQQLQIHYKEGLFGIFKIILITNTRIIYYFMYLFLIK